MFERLVKLRPFIRDVAEHVDFRNKITVYTPYQWDLVSGMIALLCPVRVLTKFTQLQHTLLDINIKGCVFTAGKACVL